MIQRAIELEVMIKFIENWNEAMIKKQKFLIDGIEQDDVLYFFILEKELIMNISSHVSSAIKKVSENKEFKYVVIDLRNVERMDSSGFGMILTLASRLPKKEKLNMFLLHASSAVMRVATLIGLPVFTYMYDDIHDAETKIKELKNASV